MQRFQLLDTAADPPRFGAPVTSTLELDASRFADPRVSGKTILATRLESAGDGTPSFGTPSVASVMLDRFEADDAGALHALAPINVPGYPAALADDGATLITLEPADDSDDVVAHALELIEDGAFARNEQRLDAVLDDFVVLGDHVYVLRHTGEGCGTVTTLQPVALDGLALGTALELPGPRYSIVDVTSERILLQAVDGFVVIELGDPVAPSLEAFVRPIPWLFAPRLAGDAVVGASYGGGRRRVEL